MSSERNFFKQFLQAHTIMSFDLLFSDKYVNKIKIFLDYFIVFFHNKIDFLNLGFKKCYFSFFFFLVPFRIANIFGLYLTWVKNIIFFVKLKKRYNIIQSLLK